MCTILIVEAASSRDFKICLKTRANYYRGWKPLPRENYAKLMKFVPD
jgi:hypothetical protein